MQTTLRLYWLLLCCWVGLALSEVPANTQLVQPAESSAKLCGDSRCSCSHSSHGVSNISCQCSPQDQVNVMLSMELGL